MIRSALFALLLGLAGLPAGARAAASAPGADIYQRRCSGCHEQVSDRIPHRSALQQMPASRIVRALDTGAMMAVALTMSRDDRIAVADYLGTTAAVAAPPASAFCADRRVKISTAPGAGWNGWSPGTASARFQSAAVAGLDAAKVKGLKLKWAYGFDGDVTAFAPVTALSGHVFVGSAGGVVQALRAATGCIEWTYQANGPVRTAVVASPLTARPDGPHALVFGDMTGWVYAVSAETGKELWKVRVETHDSARLTGSPVVRNGVAYVPVSSWEETRANDVDYPCCTFRGSVIAMRVADGKTLWRTYLVGEPRRTGANAKGTPTLGPSGIAVWSTPTIDAKRGALYITTGGNYSHPATELGDAVVALGLADGKVRWSRQLTVGDVFNSSCNGDKANCPEDNGPDHDFGSSAIPVDLPGGKSLLLAGQKSGVVYALDPDHKGALVWQQRVGTGGTNGGVQWGMSTDGKVVFAAVSDAVRTAQQASMTNTRRYNLDPAKGGGLTALRVADGSKLWSAAPPPCPPNPVAGCSPSQPGAVTGIPGVVFTTSVSGHVRANDAATGAVLWDFDTMRPFTTVNGVKAEGGSIDGPGPVVAGGMVFVNSGYPRNGGAPGNVLLAFAP